MAKSNKGKIKSNLRYERKCDISQGSDAEYWCWRELTYEKNW